MNRSISAGGVLLCLALGLVVLWLVLTRLPEAAAPAAAGTALPGWSVFRPPNDVDALAPAPDGIWAGGKQGVVRLDSETGQVLETLTCGTSLEYVRALLVDPDGTLWVGHDQGLSRRDARGCTTLTEKDGLPDRRVNALLRARSGQLWVGTWGGAAALQADGSWRTLTGRSGLLVDMVNTIMEDKDGGFWFGSAIAPQGGLSILYKGKWQYVSRAEGLPHNNVQALVQDPQGAVWAATGLLERGGTARLTRSGTQWQVVQVFDTQNGMAGNKGRALFMEPAGRMWVGSEYDGLARQTPQGW